MSRSTAQSERAEVFGSLFAVVQHLSRLADRELASMGLTSRQWLLLAVLKTAYPDSQPSLSEAAVSYGTSRQNVKQIALTLQRSGFVRLLTDPEDARTTRIALTDRVQEFDEPEMLARTHAMFDEVFAGLTAAQTRELLHLLRPWLTSLTASTGRDR